MKINKLNESMSTEDEFFDIQDIVSEALNSIGGDMDDVTGGITSSYDEDRLLLSLYSTVDRKDARKFKKNFLTTIENALSQTRFNEVSHDENHTYAYQLSRNDISNMLGSDRAEEFISKFAMFEVCITAYGQKLEEAMTIGYDEDSIKEQIRILNKNIEDYKQLIIDEPEDKDYWEEQIKKCEEEISDLQSYKPLDEAADIGQEDFIEVDDPSIVDKLDFAGAVEVRENKVYGDANTLKQLQNAIDKLEESKVFGSRANKLNEDTFNDSDEDDEGKMVGISFDVNAPSNMKESEIETIIRKAIGATDLDIPGYMEIHTLEESLNEDNKLLSIQELNPDGTPKQYDVKFMELEKVPGLLNWDVADQLEQHFRNNKLWVDELHYNQVKDCIEYDINWGDWKHEHLRSKWLLEELFKELGIAANINSHTTEEDGSDTYSAHYIVRAMGKMNEAITPPTGDDPDLSSIPQIGQDVMYRGRRTTIIDYEQDPEYGYDFLIKNPFWNGQDERFENIWVGDQIDFIDWGPDDIGLQPPG